jgi:hypothetical protein
MDKIVNENDKNKIYDELADTMIDALGRGLLSDDEATLSSKFILTRLEDVKNQSELTSFFEDLCSRWGIYRSVYNKFKIQSIKNKDEEEVNKVINKLNQLIKN